jgi:hypothetical protein
MTSISLRLPDDIEANLKAEAGWKAKPNRKSPGWRSRNTWPDARKNGLWRKWSPPVAPWPPIRKPGRNHAKLQRIWLTRDWMPSSPPNAPPVSTRTKSGGSDAPRRNLGSKSQPQQRGRSRQITTGCYFAGKRTDCHRVGNPFDRTVDQPVSPGFRPHCASKYRLVID